MKDGWTRKRLGEVLQLEYGKPLPDSERDHAGLYPVYGANGIKCRTNRFYHGKPSIIVGRKGSAGELTLSDDKFWPLDVTYFVTFDESQYDLRFLYFCLSRLNLPSLATGVKPGINRNHVYAIEADFPPLAEQKRVVAILDEAFAGIDRAIANTEKNLANARELFESHLKTVFRQDVTNASLRLLPEPAFPSIAYEGDVGAGTRTKGRAATGRHIPGPLSLAVGPPRTPAKPGWRWVPLSNVARLESGHTPSRRHPEYWNGDIPWIGITDAKRHHGDTIAETAESTNALGLKNSAARLLPKGTVCLSRTASVGYVLVMGCDMATSQDFVNWVCSEHLHAHFLKYLLMAEGDGIRRFASGSVHQTIYFPEVKAFHICCPHPVEQQRLVALLDESRSKGQILESLYRRKLQFLSTGKQSILHKAFTGELTLGGSSGSYLFPGVVPEQDTRELYAGLLAIAYERHEKRKKLQTLGDIKREKIIHLVEAHLDLSLGRKPYKIAAGPADLDRRDAVEAYATARSYFAVEPTAKGNYIEPGKHFNALLRSVRQMLGARLAEVEAFIDLFVQKNTRQSGIVATAYSAWKNLLLDGGDPTDDEIIYESRENWHADKMDITPDEFRIQLNWMRAKGVVPSARGKRVLKKGEGHE